MCVGLPSGCAAWPRARPVVDLAHRRRAWSARRSSSSARTCSGAAPSSSAAPTTVLSASHAEERARGVVAFSSGNHAQGVALAARELGIHATIVMPTDAPALKLAATRGYGAEVVLYDRLTEDREAIAHRLADERGLAVVPPYDHPLIMAGQGTAALELLEEVPELDWLLVTGRRRRPALGLRCGRKGPAAGGSVDRRGDGDVERLGAEHAARRAREDRSARHHRRRHPHPAARRARPTRSCASSCRTSRPSQTTKCARPCDSCCCGLKLLVEPTGAVPVALVLSGRATELRGQRVGVILSGGNADPGLLAEIIAA